MAFAKAGGQRLSRAALAHALLTGALISGYMLVDGLGARAAGDPHAYAAALFVIDAIPLPVFVLWTRGRDVLRSVRGLMVPGLGGGALALGSYWIAIWAMTVAPIPLVAATRETSVLFAMLILRHRAEGAASPVANGGGGHHRGGGRGHAPGLEARFRGALRRSSTMPRGIREARQSGAPDAREWIVRAAGPGDRL